MIISRRGFLQATGLAIAAPAIVKASSIMHIKAVDPILGEPAWQVSLIDKPVRFFEKRGNVIYHGRTQFNTFVKRVSWPTKQGFVHEYVGESFVAGGEYREQTEYERKFFETAETDGFPRMNFNRAHTDGGRDSIISMTIDRDRFPDRLGPTKAPSPFHIGDPRLKNVVGESIVGSGPLT